MKKYRALRSMKFSNIFLERNYCYWPVGETGKWSTTLKSYDFYVQNFHYQEIPVLRFLLLMGFLPNDF